MKKMLYILVFGVSAYSLLTIYQVLAVNNSTWINETPSLYTVSSNTASVIFSVSKPATIYWRLYTNESLYSTHELTNTNTVHLATTYGGNITTYNKYSYTNKINQLIPNTTYYLYSIAVSTVGTFPTELKTISFITK